MANFTIMPSTPDEPTTPDEPSTPDEPATPDEPSTPDEPATPDEPSTPDEPTTPDEPSTPEATFTVIWLNEDGTELDSKTYTEGQDEPVTDKTPVKESDAQNVYTFSKWTLDKTEGAVKTYKPEFIATAKEPEPQPAADEVEQSAEVGQTEVITDAIETPDITEEQKQDLISAAESVEMKADTPEERAIQEAALNNAVDNVSEEEKRVENQIALETLMQMSGLQLTDDGQLPEDVTVEVKREVFTQVEAEGYSEQTVNGIVQKALSLDINALYNTVASMTNASDASMNIEGVKVGESKPATIDKPISLSVNLPADFTDAAYVFINHIHNGKNYTYRGELGDTEDGQRSMSFVSLGLSPFEITNAASMAAKVAVDADGVAVDVYYATLQDAAQDVENNGVITLMEPVTEAIASEKGKGYTVQLASGVNADDVKLTLDGQSVTGRQGGYSRG